ncbi:MAG TPA: hypothetical protein EYP22_03900 [Methanosarcinales archaeon]|nr:hypothetical protein [Methanosarcinales archaeon]
MSEYYGLNDTVVGEYKKSTVLDMSFANQLDAMDIKIETLTPEQDKYLHSWEIGTQIKFKG